MSDLILKIRAKNKAIKEGDLLIDIAKGECVDFSNYDVGMVNSVVFSFKDEFFDYILEHGLTSLLQSELLLEQIVLKGATPSNIISIFQKYLDKMGIDNELIIIDPFFYARTRDANYTNTVETLLNKYINLIDNLYIITNNHVDIAVKNTIETSLRNLNPLINLHHKQTIDYHDRFWISNGREKGVVTGTSLNGLGNKYALIDRLNTSDVRIIIQELINDGLI